MAVTSECTQLPSKYTEHAERAGTRAGAANATVLSIARSGRGRGERKTCTGAVELGVWAGEDSRDEEEEGVEEVEEEREGREGRAMCGEEAVVEVVGKKEAVVGVGESGVSGESGGVRRGERGGVARGARAGVRAASGARAGDGAGEGDQGAAAGRTSMVTRAREARASEGR